MKQLISLVGCKQPYFGLSLLQVAAFALNTCNGGTISLPLPLEQEREFMLFDLVGNLVKTVAVPAYTPTYTFSTKGLSSGTYLYVWNQKTRGKLIILH